MHITVTNEINAARSFNNKLGYMLYTTALVVVHWHEQFLPYFFCSVCCRTDFDAILYVLSM